MTLLLTRRAVRPWPGGHGAAGPEVTCPGAASPSSHRKSLPGARGSFLPDQTLQAHAARRPQQATLGDAQGLERLEGRAVQGATRAARETNHLRETGIPGRDADQGRLSLALLLAGRRQA